MPQILQNIEKTVRQREKSQKEKWRKLLVKEKLGYVGLPTEILRK